MGPKSKTRSTKPYQASDNMKTPKRSILASKARHTPGGKNRVKFSVDSPDNSRLLRHSKCIDENIAPLPKPLLGYDWIAGVVEMDSLPRSSGGVSAVVTQDFINEIDEFRKTNRDECSGKVENANEKYLTPIKPRKKYPISPDPADTQDSRILDYTVNSRLYPVPVDPNISVHPGTKTSPRFIRISVPKSVLTTPNKFKRSIPRSTNSDSMALHDHCMQGREYSLPSRNRVPKPKLSSHLDLKASLLPDPSKRVRNVGALHSTIVNVPQSLSGSFHDPSYHFM
uniref:migration and invasion-inhibitory protein-like n=1 Tax=Styela clava TaxID=7725 RepID=UPI00193A6139|nr:migration and invasion-inhibitory protein-like [Styela clava]